MDAPSSLTCDSNSNMAVTLQWTPPTNTGGQGVMITHYNITGLPQSASCSTGPCDMVDGILLSSSLVYSVTPATVCL